MIKTPKKTKLYKRLPGKKRGPFKTQTLWQGKDHILLVESIEYKEKYRRFYYKDIQALIIRAKYPGFKSGSIITIVSLIILFAVIAHFKNNFFLVFSGFFLVLLFLETKYGPYCNCFIKTAVQTQKLPSLNRVKTAQKTLDIIRPYIEKFQGKLTGEIIDRGIPLQNQSMGLKSAPPAVLEKSETRAHYFLFIILVFSSITRITDLYINNVVIALVALALELAGFIFVIFALKDQHKDFPVKLKRLTWAVMVFICCEVMINFIFFMAAGLSFYSVKHDMWEIFMRISQKSPLTSPFMTGLYIFLIAGAGIPGITGLLILNSFQKAKNNIPVLSTPPPITGKQT